MATPILRWAGSKRKSLKHLISKWATSDRTHYIEPFCGSAALFFAARPTTATLSDTNHWLIGTYQAITRDPRSVHALSSGIPRLKQVYSMIRQNEYADYSTTEAAAAFIFLNRNCFNGLFRTNRAGRFNVPFSSSRTGPHPELEDFMQASEVLSLADLHVGDFEEVVYSTCSNYSFVYLDPPYATNNSRVFTQYNSHSFGTKDIVRLRLLLRWIDAVGGRFVVSYAEVPEIGGLRDEWNSYAITIQRNIAGFSSKRRLANEIIISNF